MTESGEGCSKTTLSLTATSKHAKFSVALSETLKWSSVRSMAELAAPCRTMQPVGMAPNWTCPKFANSRAAIANHSLSEHNDGRGPEFFTSYDETKTERNVKCRSVNLP